MTRACAYAWRTEADQRGEVMFRDEFVDIAGPAGAIALNGIVWAAVLLARSVGPSLFG